MQTFAHKPKATRQTTFAQPTISSRTRFAQSHDFNPLHPTLPVNVQTKLRINTPGDIYEQEADRVSEQVMRMPEPQLQSACPCGGGCPKCQAKQPDHEHERLQTKRVQAGDAGQIAAPPIVHEVLRSPGRPLNPAARAFMEPRFGHNFSQVRVHAGAAADQSAQDVNAHAYTVGNHIVFGAGRFAPATHEGHRLIAHELAHVLQQRITPVSQTGSEVVQRETNVRRRRQRAEALKGADARTLLEASLPFVLEHMSDKQVQQMQRVLDAAVVNPSVQKETEDLYRRSIVAQSGFVTNRDPRIVRRAERAMESFIPIPEADKRIRLDFEALLTPEALKPTTDNPDEAAYLETVMQTLAARGVWLRLNPKYVRNPDDWSRGSYSEREFDVWLSLGPYGDHIPVESGGRITRNSLKGTTELGAGYYRNVHQGEIQSALRKLTRRLSNQIDTGFMEHDRLVVRYREAALGVAEISDFLGGAEFPDRALWDQAHALVLRAMELNVGGNVRGSQTFLVAAAILTRDAGRLLEEYIEDSSVGAGRAVFVLEIAKTAGEIAEVALTVTDVVGVARGATALIRSARTASVDVAAERLVGRYVAESPVVAADLNKVRLVSETAAVAKTTIREVERQVVKAEVKAATGEAEKAVRYVTEHPKVIHGEPGRPRRAAVGRDHEIVEVQTRSGIGCEFHSLDGPLVPCPKGMGTNEYSPALKDSPYHPSAVEKRLKPPYDPNIVHDKSSPLFNPAKGVEPSDAAAVYDRAIRGNFQTWYGRSTAGDIYRYFSDNVGRVHFSASTGDPVHPLRFEEIPIDVRRILGAIR